MLVILSIDGGGYATLKHTSQGVANAKFVLLPILSPFNCIMTHLILYHIFNRPNVANRDARVRQTDTSVYARTRERLQGWNPADIPRNVVSRRAANAGRNQGTGWNL